MKWTRMALALATAGALAACAQSRPSSRGEPSRDPGDAADLACARKARDEKKRLCQDRPGDLSEDYAQLARASWTGLMERCEGPRARFFLRDLDRCIVRLEDEPNQVTDAARARRADAAVAVAELRVDPGFEHVLRTRRAAESDADAAAEDYLAARADRVSGPELQFRMESWAEAEKALREAEARLRGAISRQHLDPRDARALGIW